MDDDDCMIKLDLNIELETTVRNRFEDDENCGMFYNVVKHSTISVSSIDDQSKSRAESSQAGTSKSSQETNNNITIDSDVNSALSDISTDSGDSMAIDAPTEEKAPENSAPTEAASCLKNVNVKERIVFCIDMSTDMEKVPFITKNAELSPLSMIKRVIGIFVQNKQFIDKKHEFSLMVLYDTATWVCEFTSNARKLIDSLEDLTETLHCNSCDLSSVISLLTEKYPFIISTNPADVICIYRVILIYARSSCMIHLSDPTVRNIILDSPSFFLDVLYIHEPESENNCCLNIYEFFCNLDERDKSYIFEMTRSVSNLHSFMGKLLSHPLQRALQKNTNYRLRDLVPCDA